MGWGNEPFPEQLLGESGRRPMLAPRPTQPAQLFRIYFRKGSQNLQPMGIKHVLA